MGRKALLFLAILATAFIFQNTLYASSPERPVTVPFGMVGNNIVVNASVSGQHGHFIIDTGAPGLILNSNYFKGIAHPHDRPEIVGFRGQRNPATYHPVKDFAIGKMPMRNELALVTDFTQLEKTKGTAIHGIIGYASLKHFEVLFDFEEKTMTFYFLGKKGEPIGKALAEVPATILDLGMADHIPYLTTKLAGKKVRLGLDTGAELNLLHERFFEKNKLKLHRPKRILVNGFSGDFCEKKQGTVSVLPIGGLPERTLGVTIVDLSPLNNTLPVKLDGILGIPFLKKGKCSFNFRKKELCIWRTNEAFQLAQKRNEMDGLEAKIIWGQPQK